tara:strand:- start:27806 stop:28762 length:957 start_codon:yes stop_codon:yes gene_type:complete
MKLKKEVPRDNRIGREWLLVLVVLVILAFISMFIAGIISTVLNSGGVPTMTGNAAVIPIKGAIMVERSALSFGEEMTTSSAIIKMIDRAEKDVNVKAIVFEINSPGGSAVASEEIANRVKKIKKPTVAWIREIGTSGAYWVASATNHIVANRMSITGSIGVISSYLDFSGFLGDHNVSYQRLVSGEYKDIGSPLKPLTPMEERLFKERLDMIHDYFIEAVAVNRNMGNEEVIELSTGLFYLGTQAKDLNLIDELGNKDEVKAYLEKRLGASIELVSFATEKSFLEMLGSVFSKNSFYVGRGIGYSFSNNMENGLKIVS